MVESIASLHSGNFTLKKKKKFAALSALRNAINIQLVNQDKLANCAMRKRIIFHISKGTVTVGASKVQTDIVTSFYYSNTTLFNFYIDVHYLN